MNKKAAVAVEAPSTELKPVTCEKCQPPYTWTPRVPDPKACPRCKARMDAPKKQ